MAEKYMYVKLTKQWANFTEGQVVRFGWSKGQRRIDNDEGVQVSPQDAVNAPLKPKPKVETAMAQPKAERAEVTPKIKPFEMPKKVSRRRKKKDEKDNNN